MTKLKSLRQSALSVSLILFLSFSYTTSLSAAEWQLPLINYSLDDYGAGTQNWQIREQKNGWVYAANNYGLLEYDGAEWRVYGISNGTAVRSLDITDDGAIYVGGSNEFGRFTAATTGELIYESVSSLLPPSEQFFGEVWNINHIGDKIYFQTDNQIFIYSNEHIEIIPHAAHIYCSAAIGNALYIGAADGILVLSGNHLNALRGSELLHNQEIVSILPFYDNRLLIGTSFGGMYIYDGNVIHKMNTAVDGFLRKNQLFAMAIYENTIAFGTVLNGVVLTDLDGKPQQYINKQSELQNNTILSLMFDRQGNLWAGLDQGISFIGVNESIRRLVDNTSYGSCYTTALYNNTLYLGTNQGIYYTTFEELAPKNDLRLLDGSLGQVWNIQELGGTLYVCHHRGLFTVRNSKMVPIDESIGYWALRVLDDQHALAGTYNGLYLLQKNAGGVYQPLWKIRGYDDTTLHFEIDDIKQVWVISQKGVERLTLSDDRRSCETELIHQYNDMRKYIDMSRVMDYILISSIDWCCAVNLSNGQIEADNSIFNRLDGERHYVFIKQDMAGNLWFMTNNQLRMRPYDNVRHVYVDESKIIQHNSKLFIDGFPHLNFLDKTHILIGSVNGCHIMEYKQIQTQAMLPLMKVSIRRAIFRESDSEYIVGQSYPLEKLTATLPFGHYGLHTDFAGNMYCRAPRYATRMLPIETEFSTPTILSQREYSIYREGEYTLQVQMTDAVTGKVAIQSFHFTVLPPWYRTIWAKILWVLLTIGFILLIVWVVIKMVRADKIRIKQEKEYELREQQAKHRLETHEQEKRILQLEHEKTEYELQRKSQELSSLLLTQVNRNELISDIQNDLRKVSHDLQTNNTHLAQDKLKQLQNKLSRNRENDINWSKFEDNFDIVNGQFLKKLTQMYPWLGKNERRLCVYIHMGLYTKEIAPMMNLSTRGVEMMRYRMRTKMGLDAQANLKNFFLEVAESPDPQKVREKYTQNTEQTAETETEAEPTEE